jgi:superfamily II DNA or RNA helicase
MKKICPVCNTLNESIGFDLSERESHNLRKLNLSEHLCKSCYQAELSTRLEAAKLELVPLNKEREITQTAYHKACEAWKTVADLHQTIDYNLSMMKFTAKKKESAAIKKAANSGEPLSVEALCKQILSSLSKEQQEAIIQTFKATQNIGA